MKKWIILEQESKRAREQEEIIKILLKNRGIRKEKEIKEFLNPPSPYTLTARGLGISQEQVNKAVRRIKKAIKEKEKIVVYGDYDTDGVCATAILWETLWGLGAKVMPFIPTRDDGYGLRQEKLDELKKEGAGLVITVDQGIVAFKQIEHARKIGLDIIVTDHHALGPKKPAAFAIVHTIQLCGAGVAWYLANQFKKQKLDLVTIGTVADMMPLVGVNRLIVYHGLDDLRQTKRLGLGELYKAAGIDSSRIGTYEIGFIIGPRLNAAGRMEDPMDALRLICTPKTEQALDLAKKLDQQNRQRQSLTSEMTLQAREMWLAKGSKNNLIFVASKTWEHGIVGLVAGKLMEEFSRPTVVVAQGEEFSRASARSVNGFNMVEAVRACVDLLEAHGGHAMAAGFTVQTKKLEEVEKRLTDLANSKLTKELLSPTIKIDMEVAFEDLSFELFEKLRKLEPFGIGNFEPVFANRQVEVVDARTMGKDNQHLSLQVKSLTSATTFRAVGFGMGSFFSKLSSENKLDIAYNLQLDEWNGQHRLQLKIKDLRIE